MIQARGRESNFFHSFQKKKKKKRKKEKKKEKKMLWRTRGRNFTNFLNYPCTCS